MIIFECIHNPGKACRKFVNASDRLFQRGVTSPDSFTGKTGKYLACKQLNTPR